MNEPKVWGVHDVQSAETAKPTGCGFYRIVLPFDQLKRHGWNAGYKAGMPPPTEYDADVMVGQRLDNPEGLGYWRRFRARSKLVYELDDDIWHVDPLNWNAYNVYGRSDTLDACTHAAQVADLVTVTNQYLAEMVTAETGNTNVAICPNGIEAFMLDLERPRPQKLTIGWAGGASHSNDMREIAEPLLKFRDRDAAKLDAEIHLIGTDFRPTIGHNRARFTQWASDPRAYFRLLDFDIGLAPLAPMTFNLSKSPIKCMEYGALGIPVIASDFGPYADYVIDGVTGFLCRNKTQWLARLRELANDQDLREAMGAKAKEQAAQHTIEEGWAAWDKAYRSLL